MPAQFARELCGYRAHGKPNTSDASDQFSVDLGRALFEAMGVDPGTVRVEPTGTPLSARVAADLQAEVRRVGSSLQVTPEQPLNAFEQYRHVDALKTIKPGSSKNLSQAWGKLTKFARTKVTSSKDSSRLDDLIAEVDAALAADEDARWVLLAQAGHESLLKLDVVASRSTNLAQSRQLEVGLSLKWSLRTDRAQDCRSQGAKLSSLRRGRMPHFAAVTMEPRPYMLNLLGGGSGEVDCVYHLDLNALTIAVEQTCEGQPRRQSALETFQRLVEQRRLRDYDELVELVKNL